MSSSRPAGGELATPLLGSPYKGLTPFEDSEVDAILFFGREREREIITANLMAARLTVLYGASGVGKSSVLRAGVAHQLRALAGREEGEREHAVVVFSSWSGDPLHELRCAVASELFGSADGDRGPGSLADLLQEWTEELDLDLYLILDQAEEYFLYHGLDVGAGTFAAEFPELVTRTGLRVNVLLALREDALATLDFFKARIPNLLANRLRLDHLDREAGRAAIVGPLEAYNRLVPEQRRVEIEPSLVEAALDEVAAGALDYGRAGRGRARDAPEGEQIETPFLQLVMQRLWEVEQGAGSRTLRLETLHRLGGAQRIVEDHLEHALATLTPGEKDAAAGMFQYLVTPSGTKIAHGVSDLRKYAAVSEPDLREVLKRLSDQRILRPLSDAGDGDGGSYEIFHDVLAEAVLAWRGRHEAEREVEHARQEAERRHRRALIVAAAALLGLAAMIGVAIFALTQRSQARSGARLARAGELAATALSQLSVDPQRSLRLAVDAARLEHAPEVENALRQALIASRLRGILPAGGPVSSASFSPDGRRLLTASQDGKTRLYLARTGRLLHAFAAPGPVTAASFSRDGRRVVAASEDGAARLWDLHTGKLLHVLRQKGAVDGASFSPNGKLVVTAGADHTARIWRVGNGSLLRVLRHDQPVLNAAFSPDDRLVLTLSYRAARLYALRSGRLLRRFEQTGGVTSASFSPDGRVVVTTSGNHKARLWQVRTGRLLSELTGHVGRVSAASFSHDGKLVVTASTDGVARVWSVPAGDTVAVLAGHTNFVTDASFSRDGKSVVTSSRDRTAVVFDAATGRPLASLLGHTDAITAASFDSTGDRVVTASEDGSARIWDATKPQLRLLGRQAGSVNGASFRGDGKFVVSSGDRTADVWSVNDKRRVAVLRQRGPVTSASFSPDGVRILTTSRDHTARIWRGRSFLVLKHDAPVTDGSFSRDGRLVLTTSEDTTARLWRTDTGDLLHVLHHGAPIRTASFSPDARLVVTGGDDHTGRIWDARDGRLLQVLRGHRGPVVAAAFSPDGRLVASASSDGTARTWNAGTGARVHLLRGHRLALNSVSFSPDGELLVTGSADREARIWSVATGRTLHRLIGHFAGVSGATFSPDGRWVVTAGPTTAGLWPTETGRLLLYLYGKKGLLTSASFSPDGRRILTSSEDGTVRLYACGVCPKENGLVSLAEARLAQLSRGLTAAELRRYLPD